MENADEYFSKTFSHFFRDIDKLIDTNINIENKYIYHYTDLNGFLGIFNSKSLWASNAFYLNDVSEVEYGLNLSKEPFDKIFSSLNNNRVKDALDGFINNFSEIFKKSNLFLLSFCEDGDLLSQWRGYSQNDEGVSLGFDKKTLRELQYIYLKRIIYDENIQKEILMRLFNILDNIISHYEKNREIFIRYLNLWITEFTKILLTFKDKSFYEEKEWRIIYNYDEDNREDKEIKFRIRKNYLLPYVKVGEIDLNMLIKQIIFGPSSKDSTFAKSINYYLNINNYRKKIIYSKIPIRK